MKKHPSRLWVCSSLPWLFSFLFIQSPCSAEPLLPAPSFEKETITAEEGSVVQVDSQERIVSVTKNGETTEWEYDNDFIKKIQADGRTTTMKTDMRGRIIAIADADGAITRFDYDEFDRWIHETDDTGEKIFEYDGERRLTVFRDKRGERTDYFYDADGRLAEEKNGRGESTKYVYDEAGRLEAKIGPDGKRTTFKRKKIARPPEVRKPQPLSVDSLKKLKVEKIQTH